MSALEMLRNCVIRCLRSLVHFMSSLILGLIYGKSKSIPPIKNKLLLQPAVKLAEKIRRREVTSQEVVQAYIERINEVQPIVNAVVDNRFEEALREARRVDELIASGKKSEEELAKNTPFLGVPFSCKEHISVKGSSFTLGLVSRKGIKAAEDSEVVRRLRLSGAIPLVGTNLPELCMSCESRNKIYGTTNNPYDTRRTCGGSSGGEGALISSCGSVFGLGSDYGGSIRIPAMMNGVFGHKSSLGVVPDKGYYFEYLKEGKDYFVIGPLCRYAIDLKPIMKVLTNNLPRLNLDAPVNFRQLKIFYAEECGDNPMVNSVVPEVKTAIKKALQHFESQYQVKIQRVSLPGLSGAFNLWYHVVMEDKPMSLSEALTEGKGRIGFFSEFMKSCFNLSNYTLHSLYFVMTELMSARWSSKEHEDGLANYAKLKADFEELLKDNCVFLYPTLPEPAPYHLETILKFSNLDYTAIFNVLGYPSTHVPTSFHKGLPVGIQCVANRYNDRLTMAVAVELETVFGGWKPPAPIL